jgi:hypothetical protein
MRKVLGCLLAIFLLWGCSGPVEWQKYDTGYGYIWVGSPEMVTQECKRRGAVTESYGCFDHFVREAIVTSGEIHFAVYVLAAMHEACHMYLSAGHDKCPWPLPQVK